MSTTCLRISTNAARHCVRLTWRIHFIAAIGVTGFVLVFAHLSYAQTWNATGVSSDISAGGNWVGGTAPSFDGTANVTFSASTNTNVKLRNVIPTGTTDGDYFSTVTFDATAPAYTFSLPTGNTTNELQIAPGGNL